MTQYLIKRLILTVFVLLGVSFLAFFVMAQTPGDPAQLMTGMRATSEEMERIREQLGLNDPFLIRYAKWLGRVLQGDFGRSISRKVPVLPEVLLRFRATALLAVTSLAIACPLGIFLGVLTAVGRATWVDRITTVFALAGFSTPSFFLGLSLIIIFSLKLEWLPGTGMYSPVKGGVSDLLLHLILPAATLAFEPLAVTIRMTRTFMLEVMREEYITTARAKGVAERSVILRHALRNSLIGIVTMIGMETGWLLGGAVVVEWVFSWPGIGMLLLNAISTRDFPLMMGSVVVVASSYVLINLATDVVYAYLDPRIRYA